MNDDVDELLRQVMAALDLSDPSIEAKLRQGLSAGLEMATEQGGAFEFDIQMDGGSPEVVVLDGGRDGAPKTPSRTPDLEVVDGDGADPEDVQVRLIRPALKPLGSDGQFAVEDSTATVFRGQSLRCYRLFCEHGPLQILVDGTPADTLATGCSMDIEAAFIQVRGTGRGGYRMVSPR